MSDFSLDTRTLNFIIILFSVIFCTGLMLFQRSQKRIEGLSLFSMSIFIIGTGPFLMSFRGVISDTLSIVGANMLIALGFHLTLYSLSLFRGYTRRLARISASLMVAVFVGFFFYTYVVPSINSRIVIISSYLALVTLFTSYAVMKGSRKDLPTAVRMMGMTFLVYSAFMVFRALITLSSDEMSSFMAANIIHQITFILSIVLIVSMSFSMLWLINARLLQSIHTLSYEDPLTALHNRRALEATVSSIMNCQNTHSVNVILSDIDNFKRINDNHGHLIGDEVIRKVAEEVRTSLHPNAKAFRLGGDEIMILLPNSHLEIAKDYADSLRQSIEKIQLEATNPIELTSSFGIAQHLPTETWHELVERADRALYVAKREGRNRVSVCASHE
ncbi:sensor domain-containing diguanylate cyclase [Vibrio mexicanus]|uniref:GGDEF domain-containing protein n=1 Tax=Vibrio mexicanus TaxID=1004326 RepID=UPI00063C8203|nr:GGDEF domain-containing protein [Vibrio mexicanus]